jgi:phosphate/phosphite/phosphonate ABC transporter binding protein
MRRMCLILTTAMATTTMGCMGETSSVNGPIEYDTVVHRPMAEIYADGHDALVEAGVEVMRWGLTPYMLPEELLVAYTPIALFVERRLGVPVEVVLGDDYADLESMLVAGEIDVGVISPYSYVRAKKASPDITVFASHIARGSFNYGSYIIVKEESEIESLSDLAGQDVAFVDTRSTSGWLFPVARMLEEGVNPESDINPIFYGTHDRVFDAVVEGEVVAGATYDGALSEGRQRRGDGWEVRVIAKGERIPHEAYVARAGLNRAVSQALSTALSEISTGTQEGRRLLAPMLRINGFLPVGDSHYDVIRLVESQVNSADLSIESGTAQPDLSNAVLE